MRGQFAYRLVVDYPGTPSVPADDDGYFQWPAVRTYLSASGASRRAQLMRGYGATVVVQRSERIMWPS